MTDNIDVNPATADGKVSVATDLVDDVHYPIYKQALGADGEAELVSTDNPLPVATTTAAAIQQERIIDLLEDATQQLKMIVLHLQSMTDEHITKDDIE